MDKFDQTAASLDSRDHHLTRRCATSGFLAATGTRMRTGLELR
jgi:hypothetical protein